MTIHHVRVIEGGKIVLPAALRRKHGYTVGSTLVVREEANGISIRSLDEAVARAQAYFKQFEPDRILSDELIAERRAEAARE
jgi:bifunctional DNA-binding transcriptional regulator/antitoxin component of YhaV-PrlF toxin-antitoxin module